MANTIDASNSGGNNPSVRFGSTGGGDSKPPSDAHPSNVLLGGRSLGSIPSPNTKTSSDSSRNTSPTRKNQASETSTPSQSARGKSTTVSPTHNIYPASNSIPSAAAVQRALSSATTEINNASSRVEGQSKSTGSQNEGSKVASPEFGPSRVKSPPPSATSSRRSSLSSSRQSESSETSASLSTSQRSLDTPEKSLSPTQAQRPPRGPSGLGSRLETVEEGDHSISPNNRAPLPSNFNQIQSKPSSTNNAGASDSGNQASAKPAQPAQPAQPEHKVSVTDRSPNPSANSTSAAVAPAPPTAPSRKSSTSSLVPTKTRSNAEGSKHMTVETETVQSIPQTALGHASDRAGSTRVNTGGTLRTKHSSDTIRPKKEKRKVAKKPPPIVSGPNSTKAELFEAKVASEIDGESTDSDETFVYESNPAESQSRSRHHSRNPSTTSLASVADRHRVGLGGRVLTGGEAATDRHMRTKRSMKFASNSYASSNMDDESTDATQGTVRTHNLRSTPRSDAHHKHVSRVHRDTGHGSDSPLESDSPFSQVQKMRSGTGSEWKSPTKGSRSPRSDNPIHMRTPTTKKAFDTIPFDTHSVTSEDEREPLLRSLRNPRARGPHHLRHINFYDEPARRSSCCATFTGCVCILGTVVLLVALGGGFVFATSKPLYGVSIMEIQNVLASEQEIMLDLLVQATNPNVAQITISDTDVNVFAKSRHVADPNEPDHNLSRLAGRHSKGSRYRRLGRSVQTHSTPVTVKGNVDDGTDPICPPWEPDCDFPGDADHDQQTMLLGRVFHFDSALSFEPSPLRQAAGNSSGELRLAHPGNKTESGGSERWERVIQHPFELIIRGILKYQLPLSTREQTRSVGASVLVHPEEGVDEHGVMRIVQLGRLLPSEEYEKNDEKKKNAQKTSEGVISIPEQGDEVGIPEHNQRRRS